MVLGEVAHAVVARLVPPILEVKHTRLDVLEQRGRDQWAVTVHVKNAQQPGDGEVAAILSPVNALNSLVERPLVEGRRAQLKPSNLAEEARTLPRRLGRAVVQVQAAALIEWNGWRWPVWCIHIQFSSPNTVGEMCRAFTTPRN